MLFLFYCMFFIIINVGAKHEEYQEYRLYNIKLKRSDQQELLHKIKNDLTDFWRNPSFNENIEGRVMIPPSQFVWFEERLEELDIEGNVEIPNVFEYLNEKDKQLSNTLTRNSALFDYEGYYKYDKILEHLYKIQDEYVNDTIHNVDLIEYGKTAEGRPLAYLKLNKNNEPNKPVILVEAAINPREWITVPAALNVVEKVLINEELLDNYEWIVIPVLNPDGYEYTHTNLRLWTKSMSQNSNLSFICPGVNLNRNFDMDWMISASSSSPCSHLYAGIEPSSEVETQMVKTLIDEFGKRLKMYISLQNKNGFVTYPWQFEQAASGMFRQHYLVGDDMVKSSKYEYKLDIASVAIGERISGTSADYARQKGVLYAYNIEIIGRGDDFVFIPEEEIKNVVDDVFTMVYTAANKLILI